MIVESGNWKKKEKGRVAKDISDSSRVVHYSFHFSRRQREAVGGVRPVILKSYFFVLRSPWRSVSISFTLYHILPFAPSPGQVTPYTYSCLCLLLSVRMQQIAGDWETQRERDKENKIRWSTVCSLRLAKTKNIKARQMLLLVRSEHVAVSCLHFSIFFTAVICVVEVVTSEVLQLLAPHSQDWPLKTDRNRVGLITNHATTPHSRPKEHFVSYSGTGTIFFNLKHFTVLCSFLPYWLTINSLLLFSAVQRSRVKQTQG